MLSFLPPPHLHKFSDHSNQFGLAKLIGTIKHGTQGQGLVLPDALLWHHASFLFVNRFSKLPNFPPFGQICNLV